MPREIHTMLTVVKAVARIRAAASTIRIARKAHKANYNTPSQKDPECSSKEKQNIKKKIIIKKEKETN